MMAFIVTSFPDQDDTSQTVTISDGSNIIRLYWRERLMGWYYDIRLVDNTAIALGRRLSSDYGPLMGLVPENRPAGEFIVQGPSGYARDDFGSNEGDALLLWYFGVDDLLDPDTTDLDVTYTIP